MAGECNGHTGLILTPQAVTIDLEAAAERIVNAPPERVFALIADARRSPEWDP